MPRTTRIFLDGEHAHPACGKGLADFTGQLAGGQTVSGVIGQVAQIAEVPQCEFRRAAVHRVAEHFRRQAKARHFDGFAQTFVLHRLGAGLNANGRGRHDQAQIGVAVDQRQRPVIADFGLIVAIHHIDQFNRRIFRIGRQGLLHRRDPGVLVGGIGRGRQHGHLAAILAQNRQRHIGHDHADRAEIDLCDEHVFTGTRRNRAVPCHHLDASGLCGLCRGGNLVTGVIGQHDRALALGGRRGHDLDLARDRVFRRRPDEQQFARVGQFGMRLLRTFIGLIEHHDAEEFRQQDHVRRHPRFQRHRVAFGKTDGCRAHHQCSSDA